MTPRKDQGPPGFGFDEAYQLFTGKMMSRDIAAGELIPNTRLVALTGLSVEALADFIPRLEEEGLIQTVSGVGIRIVHVDATMIKNSFQLRLLLENEAIACFCQTVSDARLNALKLQHERLLLQSGLSTPQIAIADFQQTSWAFHEEIIASMGSDLIAKTYRTNFIRIQLTCRDDTVAGPNLVRMAIREHLDIIAAVKKRDVDEAIAAMTIHVKNVEHRALNH